MVSAAPHVDGCASIMGPMKAAIVRWAFYLAALLVFGPLAGMLLGGLRGVDGSPDATPLVSTSPALGVALGLGALAIAMVLGAAAARLVGPMAGMTTAGLVVAWASWRTGTVDELVRTAGSGQPLIRLAIEGLIFGVAGVLLGALLWRAAPLASRGKAEEGEARSIRDPQWAIAMATAVVAGGFAAAFIAG